MNLLYLNIVLSLLIFSCNGRNLDKKEETQGKGDGVNENLIEDSNKENIAVKVIIDNSEEIIDLSNSDSKDTIIENFKYETKVNDIELLSPESIEDKLSHRIIGLVEPDNSFPYLLLTNSSRKEFLKLTFHYGGIKNAFSEFEIKKYGDDNVEAIELNDEYFESGNLVRLGMREDEIIDKLGKPNKIEGTKLIYRIVDSDLNQSEFLRKYNYPSYFVICKFEHNELISYKFGFDYP